MSSLYAPELASEGTGWCWPLRHPSHPASVGLACRPVGAWRRRLVKQLDSTRAWAWQRCGRYGGGKVTDACRPRHTHAEFLAFLKQVAKAYPLQGREQGGSAVAHV